MVETLTEYYFEKLDSDIILTLEEAMKAHPEFLADNYTLIKRHNGVGTICSNHNGKQCPNEGIPWNILTLGSKQVIHTFLCNKHRIGEDYSGDKYDRRHTK